MQMSPFGRADPALESRAGARGDHCAAPRQHHGAGPRQSGTARRSACGHRAWGFILAAGLALLALLCADLPSARAAEPRLTIVATTGMIADAARTIGGDAVEVKALMGPGVDPHAYRQTRSDIVALTRAELVLWHGLYLEAQLEDFMRDLAKRRRVVAVGERVSRDRLHAHDAYPDKFDPHIWMDPARWREVAVVIRDVLIEARPGAREIFERNGAAFLDEIDRLDAYAHAATASIPEDKRVLVTAHDAFGYFGRAHGFEVVGIQGISTESEAGLNRITALVDLLVTRGIGAVFVESSVSDRNIRALIEGAAARGHRVVVGGELYSDAMGADGTYEGTYIGMIDHNVTIIARALGGGAPERGLNGRLSVGG